MNKVTIIGAGNVGATVAQALAERNALNIVLLDIKEGVATGKALDLMQSLALTGKPSRLLGTGHYADTRGSSVVVITAGSPRKPGMSRDDLLKINSAIVAEAAAKSVQYSPNARFVVVSNPLDVMTYLVWQVTGLPWRRVIGMAGVLDSARFQAFIAEELQISVEDVRAMVLGSHGDQMVPLPRFSTVNGVPVTELLSASRIKELCERTRNGGAEIVTLLENGSAWYAPGAATAFMVEAILKGSRRLLPCSVHSAGKYGLPPVCVGLPVILGSRGVERIIQLNLNASEMDELALSAAAIEKNIALLKQLPAKESVAAC
ncbi:MAG TPA: malate dehydrogenase [Candidatus Obscuribacterales bacterium]